MSDHREPPKWPDRLLEFFVKGDLLEEIQGDLFEYYQRLGDLPQWKSTWIYAYHVLHFLRPFALKRISQNSNKLTMLKFNIIIAWRNLLKQKLYSGINIIGLAIGLASAAYIAIYVLDEMSFDEHFENSDRIVRVAAELKMADNYWHFAVSPAPLAAAYKSEFPEIEKAGRFRNEGSILVKKQDELVELGGLMFADQEILEVFNFKLVHGTLANALTEPNTAVLSHKSAQRIFGDNDPVGETFTSINNISYEVSAVVEDLPTQTHFSFDVLISMENYQDANNQIWLSNNYHTYFLLHEGTRIADLENKFSNVYAKYYGPQLQAMAGISYEDAMAGGGIIRHHLQPITDIHLTSGLDVELGANSSMQYIYIFMAVGAFLVLIAAINFINISTARASTRAKEIGIKKVMGSFRSDLITQFLTESVFQAVLATTIGLIMVIVCLPIFNAFVDKQIVDPLFGPSALWWKFVLGGVLIGLIAGIYPAIYLSKFKPVEIMKNNIHVGKSKASFRSVLVVFQFAISLVLIIGTIIVFNQLNYIRTQNLGFDRDKVVLIENSNTLRNNLVPFTDKLNQLPEVEAVSVTSFIPTGTSRSDNAFKPKGDGNVDATVSLQIWNIDPSYFDAFGMELLEGRTFDSSRPADSSAIVLNETAVRRFGLEDPIGKTVEVLGDFTVAGKSEFEVIGVVKDFNYSSIHENVGAMGLYMGPFRGYYTVVKTTSDNYPELLSKLESNWEEFSPSVPFSYQFLDEVFEAQYRAEQKLGSIFTVFTSLALFIACLGLFGLSAYTAEQRRKEIGVRKVLGASVTRLIIMLLGHFTKLLIIAVVLAIPISWYIMSGWLDGFAYRMNLSPMIFIVGSLLALLVAWVTVSFQSARAALSNPTDNLKYE
ncbi:MAG: ABC transporter permease [Cyclobacteriaceae bacterium]